MKIDTKVCANTFFLTLSLDTKFSWLWIRLMVYALSICVVFKINFNINCIQIQQQLTHLTKNVYMLLATPNVMKFIILSFWVIRATQHSRIYYVSCAKIGNSLHCFKLYKVKFISSIVAKKKLINNLPPSWKVLDLELAILLSTSEMC